MYLKQNTLVFNISEKEKIGYKIGKVFENFFTIKMNDFQLLFEFAPYFNNSKFGDSKDFPFEIDTKLGIIKLLKALDYKKVKFKTFSNL